MLKIGDFSKLSRVSIKTLRFYYERGLLEPSHVDDFSGYRYYTVDQLARLNRIMAMKELGFSLDQIGDLMRKNLSPERMGRMLRERKLEIEKALEAEQNRLALVEARLNQIEQEGKMSEFEVVIKPVEPVIVASLRETIGSYPEVGRLYNELYRHLGRVAPGNAMGCAAIWHDPEYKETDIDAEAIVYLNGWASGDGHIRVYELPAVDQMACLIYQGPYSQFNQAYEAIIKWIDSNGYRIAGPNREIYLQSPKLVGDQNDVDCVSEIQFPVEKAA